MGPEGKQARVMRYEYELDESGLYEIWVGCISRILALPY